MLFNPNCKKKKSLGHVEKLYDKCSVLLYYNLMFLYKIIKSDNIELSILISDF